MVGWAAGSAENITYSAGAGAELSNKETQETFRNSNQHPYVIRFASQYFIKTT